MTVSIVFLLLLVHLVFARDELIGTHLRGCALLEFPYVKRGDYGHRSTSGYTGVAIEYLEKLRDEVGFSIQLVKWNSTFRAFVDHMSSCATPDQQTKALPVPSTSPRPLVRQATGAKECLCDIGVGAFTMTNDRVSKIDFLWPFANENHRMISRRSDLNEVDSGALSYMFNTFSPNVWLLIALAVLVYALGTAAYGDITPVNAIRYPRHRAILRARRTQGGGVARKRRRESSDACAPCSMTDSLATETTMVHRNLDDLSSNMLHLTPEGYPAAQSYDNINTEADTTQQVSRFQSLKDWLYPRTQRLGVASVYSFAMFIGHPCEADSAGSRASSIHRMSWRLLSLTAGIFLFSMYNASLTVLLFESVKSSRFRTLEDVKECVISPSSVSFIRGGASQDLWTNAITSRNYCNDNKSPRALAKSIEHGLQLLREKKVDFFFSLEGAVLSVVNRQCDKFAVVGEPFFSTSIGFIVPKNASIKAPLDRATRVLREQDAFQSARNIAMRSLCEEASAATISMDRLTFFFAAYFAAAFVLIVYRVCHLRHAS